MNDPHLNISDRSPLSVVGRVGLWEVPNDGSPVRPITYKFNQIQYSWGFIAAQCIGRGLSSYRVRGMYVEYENVADPADPVTVPTFGRDEGIEYYTDLAFHGTRDFLRVPMIQDPMLTIENGFEDHFTEGQDGNLLTFFALTQGTAGVHGKAYSNAVNSKVFGASLVATPTFADRTQDVVFARTYFDLSDQTVKEVSSQIGITWEIAFIGPE